MANSTANPHLQGRNPPITVPQHSFFTSPVSTRSQPSTGQKELPLHLISLILSYLDDAADLARVTRTSRLFYYMTLPKLYENVTLRSYSEIRYVNGRPEGYGNGSPFAVGLNTLVSKPVAEYVQRFRIAGEWREHDLDDYTKGRVPDNTMMLSVALRAALDRMKNLKAFAWELNTKPMQTVYQSIIGRPTLTSLTLRQPTKRIPRPTVLIPPMPNLRTLIVYDIDPLCYPDDISLLLLKATRLDSLTLHWNRRMREMGEESVNLMNYFGRCLTSKHTIPIKRLQLYNLYARHTGDGFDRTIDPQNLREVTLLNSMGTSDPMTVFLDDTWRLSRESREPPKRLRMMRGDCVDKEHVQALSQFHTLERLYLVTRRSSSKASSSVASPATPSCLSIVGLPEQHECVSLASEYLAVIQSNHRRMRHLLLPDCWLLNDDALIKLCQACPDLEQLGCAAPLMPFEVMRRMAILVPKLWVLRFLIRPGTEFAEKMINNQSDVHQFAMATELWRPEYRNLKYVAFGEELIFKLGGVLQPASKSDGPTPEANNGKNESTTGASEDDARETQQEKEDKSLNAKIAGPRRVIRRVTKAEVSHIEIWKYSATEFDPECI